MKKVLIGIGALVALVLVAAVVVPYVVPLDTYKEQIARQVEDATGRKMTIGGDLKLSVLPRLEVAASKVTLANAPGGKARNMLELGEMRVAVGLLPLLSGKVAIDTFVLVDPVINLEVDRNGRKNWEFKAADKKPEQPSGRGEPADKGGGVGLKALQLGDVRLVNGRVTYSDATSNTTERIDAINMKVSLPDLDQRFNADGSLNMHGEKIDLKVAVEKPRVLVDGGETPLEARVTSKHVNLSFKGSHREAAAAATKGAVELNVPSMRALAAWLGEPLKGNPDTLNKLVVKGNLDMAGKTVTFADATLEFDDTKGRGDIKIVQDKRPFIQAKLALDKINLNPYMGAKKAGEKPAGGGGGPAGPTGTAPEGWSDEPIDVSGLRSVDADLALEVGGIEVEKIKVGKSALAVALKGGKLDARLTELALYGGSGKGRITVDASGAVPAIASGFELTGLQAEPFMTDAMDLDRVSGTAHTTIETTTRGRSQKEMVSALNGKGAIKFLDGAIKGINVGAMVRNASTAFLDPKAWAAQKTDFTEFGGTFTIANGILSNQDMALKSPLVRVDGRGTSDLPRRTVDYRIVPKLVASAEGQGGRDASGTTVPIAVTGPWDNLSYKPDLSAAIDNIAKDPSKALEDAKRLLQRGGSSGGTQPGQTKPSPEDTIRRLLNR